MEKLLENEAPLVTLVNMIGAFDANPISTYTRNIEKNNLKDVDTIFLVYFVIYFEFSQKILTYYADPC